MKIFLRIIFVFCLFYCHEIFSQGINGSIQGKILVDDNKNLSSIWVELVNESTGFSTRTQTNTTGEYYFQQLPLGGPYNLKVTDDNGGEWEEKGFILNQGDQLTVDFNLQDQFSQLEEVIINAAPVTKTIAKIGAVTSVTATDLARLPVNGRNYTSLTDLSPLSSGSNLSGQLGSSVNFTIDGMTAKNPTSGGSTNRNGGPYAISMEAIREFEIVTNQYDVTYGRSGGGTISSVTKSGTNTLKGSLFTFGRADWLSSPYDIRGNKRKADFSTYQYGFSLGGPIIKNKAHFFIAWDHQDDKRPIYIADIHSIEDEKRYNVSQTTLDRYLAIARNKYGVASSPQFGAFNKKQGTDAVFFKLDWQLNDTNLFTLRNNYINDSNHQAIGDNTSINLYEVYGDVKSVDNSLMASLRSVFSTQVTNELKIQHLYTAEKTSPNKQLPSQNIPRAIVERVESEIEGKMAYTSIQLGGQRYIPENFYNNVIQLVDNVYYTTDRFKYTLGIDLMYTHMNSRYGSEANGRFYFSGLDNFDTMKPYRYTREIYTSDEERVKQNILASGVYGQLQTQLFNGFQMTAGIRLDYTDYMNTGRFNPLVFEELGIKTNNKLNTLQFQPRIQFTWDIDNQHKDILRLGGGIFGSDINNYALINNMVFDGSRMSSVDLVGSFVPTPDFISYRENPLSAPGKNLLSDPSIPRMTTINTNAKNAKVPTVYKANFTYSHFFNSRFKIGLSFYTTLARHNYMYIDRNMVDEPFFRIASEANRAVYVPVSGINPVNGVTDWTTGRKTSKVGRVLELTSQGKINQFAFIFDTSYKYHQDGQFSFSYTWNDSKDNTSYNGNVANSATLSLMVKEDPRNLRNMTYSDNQFRNKIIFYGTSPSFWGINIGLRFSGFGGTRYSLAVNGNVNGDFVSTNDLAYIYNPDDLTTPAHIREGLHAILANPKVEQSFKNYIKKSYGKIAERNGGVNRFYGTFDLRISKKFKTILTQNIELSVDIFNFLNLLNKDWGAGYFLGKQYIYSIKSFDADKKEFVYTVNPNAGISSRNGNPYQIQIGIRYNF
ncbi:TonB-dependent receptor [Apibacter sp. HY039]|uniref:TonB-dependent receptor n=1 Tax=Apibacter sp. HY039 TaxID=2501476 RepID=UPI000FEC19E4|nr:carboxypeptidase regulatory-like domain-containing protein [Apibacter sp. HY039]